MTFELMNWSEMTLDELIDLPEFEATLTKKTHEFNYPSLWPKSGFVRRVLKRLKHF